MAKFEFEYIPVSIRRENYTWKGKRVILDTSILEPEWFETMLMYANGKEIVSKTARNQEIAIEDFEEIRRKYA